MTSRNYERTGKRHVTRLSGIARGIADIRAIDIDLVPYCPRCRRPLAFCEVKRVLAGDAEWDQMRRHAAFYGHGTAAILVIESDAGPLGVRVYDSGDGTISPVDWGGDECLTRLLEKVRDDHECW